ncbi:MAG: GNAT family N-acetyltransferase [Anaerolineae bacterium]|nr:GNAT family N-acetyltransferase [Anaerolineae bacterium]
MLSPLETERLILRPFELADAATLQVLLNDERIASTTLNIPYPYPEGAALEWIHRRRLVTEAGLGYSFAIVRGEDNALMGACSLGTISSDRWAEMGYWLGVAYWGQGYMTEAVRRLIAFAFDELELNRVCASHFIHNPASGKVMQKAGMTYEGTMKGHVVKGDKAVDLVWYAILRTEYEGQT